MTDDTPNASTDSKTLSTTACIGSNTAGPIATRRPDSFWCGQAEKRWRTPAPSTCRLGPIWSRGEYRVLELAEWWAQGSGYRGWMLRQ